MPRAWILVAALLAGCEFDDEDFCEPKDGLSAAYLDHAWSEYVDSGMYRTGVLDLAAGGTERYAIHAGDGCGGTLPQSPIAQVTSTGAVVATAIDPMTFEVRATAAGHGEVQIVAENGLALRRTFEAHEVASVALVTDEDGRPEAFLTGTSSAKIALFSDETQPLIDRRLTVAGPLGIAGRWNLLDLHAAPPGDYDVEILAGDSGWPVTVTVVDGIDAIVPDAATIAVPSDRSEELCFHATRGGAIVGGVPWKLDFDRYGGSIGYNPNCVTVWKGSDRPAHMIVTANALGLSASTTVTFTD